MNFEILLLFMFFPFVFPLFLLFTYFAIVLADWFVRRFL